jgi:hypothetical protein
MNFNEFVFIFFGISLVMALVISKGATLLKTPLIVGYIVAGAILGPDALKLISNSEIHSLDLINTLVLSFIGFGVGGAGGKGIVYRGGKAVADAKMTQVTVGLQLGGQKYAEVIFFENAKAYNDFMSGTYEFAAQVSAIALKSGASANAKYKDGILVVTMGKGGLMYEASVGGQKFKVTKY